MALFGSSKKGFIGDYLVLFLVIFVFALVCIFILILTIPFNQFIQNSGVVGVEAKQVSSNGLGRFPLLFDVGFIMLFVLLLLSSFFTARMINTSPMFFVIALIAFLFLFGIVAIMGVFLQGIDATGGVHDVLVTMPMTYFFIRFWIVPAVVSALVILGGLFIKGEGNYA